MNESKMHESAFTPHEQADMHQEWQDQALQDEHTKRVSTKRMNNNDPWRARQRFQRLRSIYSVVVCMYDSFSVRLRLDLGGGGTGGGLCSTAMAAHELQRRE